MKKLLTRLTNTMPERFLKDERGFFIDPGGVKHLIELQGLESELPLIVAHAKAELFKTKPYARMREEVANLCDAMEAGEKQTKGVYNSAAGDGVLCVNTSCNLWDEKHEQNCSGMINGESAVLHCPTYLHRSTKESRIGAKNE